MKYLIALLMVGSAAGQAIVQQTNCPKVLTPGTIVAAQAVGSMASYPVIILACYTLDSAGFTVDNTTSPPTIRAIASNTNFSDSEVPVGSINGVNASFTTANTPKAGSLKIIQNGVHLDPLIDYSIVGNVITMTYAPANNDTLIVDYRY